MAEKALAETLTQLDTVLSAARTALSRTVREQSSFTAMFIDLSENLSVGLDLARQVRADPAHSNLPLMGITATQGTETNDVISKTGINALLLKTLRRAVVVESLTKLPQTKPLSEKGANAPPPMGRVLVAEDNEVNQRVISAILNKLRFSADIVPDGDPWTWPLIWSPKSKRIADSPSRSFGRS